jgi:hypothetical protein
MRVGLESDYKREMSGNCKNLHQRELLIMTTKEWLRALCVVILTCLACSTSLTAHAQVQPNDNLFGALSPTQSTPAQGQLDQSTSGQSEGVGSTNQQYPQLPDSSQDGTSLNGSQSGNRSSDSLTDRNGRRVGQNGLEPPVLLTPYQRLVASSVGKVLPIFGSNLFNNVPATFAPVDRIPVTPEYLIGPGDELLIRLWGR